jgi:hypothetical protein
MTVERPWPVATYVPAEQAMDPEMLARCFADDALVHDEGRDYRGLGAIRAWKREVEATYQCVIEPLDA